MKCWLMNRSCLLLILFFCVSIEALESQTKRTPPYYYSHKVFTAKDGLTQSLALQVLQDSAGYLWISTREGINRFDGLKFENHLSNPTYPDDLMKWMDIRGGNLIFSGQKGIYRYANDRFEDLLVDLPQGLVPSALAVEEDNKIWIAGEFEPTTIYLYEFGKLQKVELNSIAASNFAVSQLFITKLGDLFITVLDEATQQYALIWRKPSGEESILTPGSDSTFSRIIVGTLLDELYISYDRDIYSFTNGELNFLTNVPFEFKSFCIRDNQLLVTDRLTVFEFYKGEWIDYGLDLNFIQSILIDKDKRVWLGTEEGLVKIRSRAIECYPHERGMTRNTWTIIEDDLNQYWFASFRYGIVTLDDKKKVYERKTGYEYFLPQEAPPFYTGGIKRQNGDLLFPAMQKVLQYSPGKGFKELEEGFVPKRAIQDIKEYNDTLYLATKGLKIIYPDGTSQFYDQANGLDISRLRYLEAMERGRDENLWLISHFGLAIFNGKDFQHYFKGEDLEDGFNCVYRDFRENLWFGSHSGLYFYDYHAEIPRRIVPKDVSELTGSIKFISAIDSSYLLLGMLDRVVLLDLQKFYKEGALNYTALDIENGFEGEDCIQGSGLVDSKGDIWIASRTMVHKLMPDRMEWDHSPKPVVLEKMIYQELPSENAFDTLYLPEKNWQGLEILRGCNVSFHFFCVNHADPEKTKYQYRLKGYENEFSQPSTQRLAKYTNLPIGKYQFEVKSFLNNQTSITTQFPVVVKPRFIFERTSVQVFGFLTIFLVSIYQFDRKRKAKRKAESLGAQLLETELERLKLQQGFLLNQINPHFTFNILNALDGLISEKRLLQAQRYIGMIGDIFRAVLYDDKKLTRTLQEELDFIENYLQLEKVRFPEKFSYQCTVDQTVKLGTYIPKMSIQTFVNNAVKHGLEPLVNGGRLSIEVSSTEDYILVSIVDNGVGRRVANGRAGEPGKGISIVLDMFDWFNRKYFKESTLEIQDLNDPKGNPIGTAVNIRIYAHYEHK